jgi:hypothetical protein
MTDSAGAASGLGQPFGSLWPIATFRCDAEIGRYQSIADIDQSAPIKFDL